MSIAPKLAHQATTIAKKLGKFIPSWFFALLLVIPPTALAQIQHTFEHLSTENGLSHGNVSTMFKDSRGFMWFGTWNGLNRYDGYEFKVFKPGNVATSGPSSNRIGQITEDALGNIWVMTADYHAFRLNIRTEQLEPVLYGSPQILLDAVRGITTAKGGDVWVYSGTKGVVRIVTNPRNNRFESISISTQSTPKLPDDAVEFVVEDSLHRIWVNTRKGIVCFDVMDDGLAQAVFNINTNMHLNHNTVTCMHAAKNKLLFGTTSGNLLVLNTSDNTTSEIELNNNSPITTIKGDGNNKYFLGTQGNSVIEVDADRKFKTRRFTNPTIQNVLALFPDSNGLLWIESDARGIAMVNLRNGSFSHFTQPLEVAPDMRTSPQCGIMEDAQHNVWMTLKGGGFGYYNATSNSIEYFFNKPGAPDCRFSNFVNCFYCDPTGMLWMSTYFKGIEKITTSPKQFRLIQPATNKSFSNANEVRALLYDSKGRLWVATKNQQLFLLDNDFQVVKTITLKNGLPFGMVYCLMEDQQGRIFVGTKGNGLFVLTPEGREQYSIDHYEEQDGDVYSLSDNNIYTILQDTKGRIWIGTYGGGINLWQNGRFLHAGNELSRYPIHQAPKIRHLAEDKNGNIWMACNGGLVHLHSNDSNANDFTFYSSTKGNADGLNGSDVFWIFCGQHNDIWVSSMGGGISKLTNYPNGKPAQTLKFTSLTVNDGLPSDAVLTFAPDTNGNLWLSTENGLACLDTTHQVFRHFGRSDGIDNPTFSEGSMAVRHDGTFCFGANTGLYAFHPSQLLENQIKIDLCFTEFKLFDKEVIPADSSILVQAMPFTTSIRLKHHQNAITLSWTGLNAMMDNKIQYAVKLEGYDTDWHFAGNRHHASYAKLPPGQYVFTVKYINPELQKLNQPLSLAIEILPPWWKTGWAMLLYLLIGVANIEMARRTAGKITTLQNSVLIEKELTETKLRFFTNISHELRTPLTLILGPAEELQMNEKLTDQGMLYTQLIRNNAQRLLRTVSQLLDLRKIESNKLELTPSETNIVLLCQTVCQNFERLATEKNIRFGFRSNVAQLSVWLDAEKMESVLFNLLSNAFKFTPNGGTIEIVLTYEPSTQALTIEVVDTGLGITKEQEATLFSIFASQQKKGASKQPGTGIGLALTKELVQLHGGHITYKPTAGGGSTFMVGLKVESHASAASSHPMDETSNNLLSIEPFVALPPKPEQAAEQPCVLVVEDNDELRRFIALQLSGKFRLIEACNGKEGIEKAQQFQPDMIVSDVIMPEMDGLTMLERLKNDFSTSHIPVVLLTSKSSVESQIEGLRYGADAYLTKPFHSGQLLAQLDNLLRQRVLLRELYTNQTEIKKTTDGLTEKDAAFLSKVAAIIETNITDTEFKTGDIYVEMGMGRSKFYDKLKGLTGLSPIDFVKEARLTKAKQLLETGDCNVSEASFKCGFSDAGYFSKCYKERFGVSPSSVKKG